MIYEIIIYLFLPLLSISIFLFMYSKISKFLCLIKKKNSYFKHDYSVRLILKSYKSIQYYELMVSGKIEDDENSVKYLFLRDLYVFKLMCAEMKKHDWGVNIDLKEKTSKLMDDTWEIFLALDSLLRSSMTTFPSEQSNELLKKLSDNLSVACKAKEESTNQNISNVLKETYDESRKEVLTEIAISARIKEMMDTI